MATFDPTRLYSTLLNTGLQVKDNALYQVIHDLIAALATINKQTNTLAAGSSTPATVTNLIQQLTEITDFGFEEFQIPNINSSVTNIVNNVNNTIQQISDSSSDSNFVDDFQISGPIGPPGPIVPYHIGINETFFVPLYKQALFAMNIDNEGTIEVEGFLIEVDGIPVAGSWTPSFTFATPGDAAVSAYATRIGRYTKIGDIVIAQFNVIINAGNFTWTTASGFFEITGLPFTSLNPGGQFHAIGTPMHMSGIAKAGYTQFATLLQANTTYLIISATASGSAAAAVMASDLTSGLAFEIDSVVTYHVTP